MPELLQLPRKCSSGKDFANLGASFSSHWGLSLTGVMRELCGEQESPWDQSGAFLSTGLPGGPRATSALQALHKTSSLVQRDKRVMPCSSEDAL